MANHRKTSETILALDPGLRELGYAVFADRRLIAASVLPLRSLPRGKRLIRVRDFVLAQLQAYGPHALVLEHIPRRPLDLIGGLPALGRLLRRIARKRGLTLALYSARSVRRTIVGDGWAGKREVAKALTARFPDLRVYLTQDRKWKERYWQNMFDAVALALHHQTHDKPPSRSR